MKIEDHYQYPSPAAEFGRFNFHRPAAIDKLVEFVTVEAAGPKSIQLIGPKGSGRHYLLRAAAFEATQRGHPTTVMEVNLDGYEPDHPLKAVFEHLANLHTGPAANCLADLAKRTKVELKVTPVNFHLVSLSLKWDPTGEELLRLFQSPGPTTPGPKMSEREQLGQLLERMTERQRLILHFRDGSTAPVDLRARLADEARLNPKLYLAFSYPEGKAGPISSGVHRTFVASWTQDEMERAIRRIGSTRIPNDFSDFLWACGATREDLTRTLLRISIKRSTWMAVSDDGEAWVVKKGWQKEEGILKEFSRDLFEPLDELLLRILEPRQTQVWEFLVAAALCDPTIPVRRILTMQQMEGEAQEEFINFVDDLLGEDAVSPVLVHLGFSHPGFPRGELLYRFANPLLPGVVLKRSTDTAEAAVRLLNALTGMLRPDSRAIANLYFSLAERAGSLHEAEKYEHQLQWWTSVEETEALCEFLSGELRDGGISPQLLWSIIEQSQYLWPPARRMALLDAYGSQPGGVPSPNLFDFLLMQAELLRQLGRFEQARISADLALSGPAPEPEWLARALAHNMIGMIEVRLSHFHSAEDHLNRAVQLLAPNLEPDHLELMRLSNSLASLYENQGRYEEAEPLFVRALSARERVLGAEHPDTLRSVNNLASLYKIQGRYEEAEPLLVRALSGNERVLGAEHPETLNSVNNLAFLYESQGRYGEAEPLLMRALSTRERVLGAKHPDTLTSVNNLAALYDRQGRYKEAEPLFVRALSTRERVLGAEHPDTLTSVNNLAALYDRQGRYKEAEPLLVRALSGNERVLGAEHPDTLTAVNNLASLYASQGRYKEAEPLFVRTLSGNERVLGAEHPHTLSSVNNLASLYENQGRYEEAEPLLMRALSGRERVLGAEHPHTLTSVNDVAWLYQKQGRHEEAEPLYVRALSGNERVLGAEHPHTLNSMNNLALLYERQGRHEEAQALRRRCAEKKTV